jgi:hypothetical protein
MSLQQSNAKTQSLNRTIGRKAIQVLIRSIQEKQGDTPCFQTGNTSCDRVDCRWRGDCQSGER